MRYTILIATLSAIVASVLTTVAISGSLLGADTATSANTPVEAESALSPGSVESILQGDINCDGVVDAHDTLGGLRFLGELDVPQTEPCPDIGTLAAIPGPQGEQGPPGPTGPQGPPGLSDLQVVFETSVSNSACCKGVDATCPAGTRVIAGGTEISGFPPSRKFITLTESWPLFPFEDANSWRGLATEIGTGTTESWSLRVWAVCATVAE